MSQNKANLDPWHVLRTVIDAGGFAQAANQLQRSQSAVSYAISKLQDQLGVELLTIQGRRAVLTASGQLLLERARWLLDQYDDVLVLAEALQQGHEPALSLWIDSLCPSLFLRPVLGEFQTHFPKTNLSIHQDFFNAHSAVELERSNINILVSSQRIWETSCQNLGEMVFVAVSHPNHPLQGMEMPIPQASLQEHRRVVIGRPEQHISANDSMPSGPANWYVSNHQHALQAILMGQAYGWLQEDLIGNELASDKLRRLSLNNGERYTLPIYMQLHPERRLGPAGQSLLALIKKYSSQGR